ncbi:MAG: hypothetical protein R2695_16555 [Acidimicrobiales bacterium]
MTIRSGSYAAMASTLGVNPSSSEIGAARRVVGVLVDGDHLLPGADREEDLGRRGRQRDDPLRGRVGLGWRGLVR